MSSLTIVELVKLLNDTDDPLEISFSNNQVNFKFNDIDLITKVIDGKFPDYERVLPRNGDKIVLVRSLTTFRLNVKSFYFIK